MRTSAVSDFEVDPKVLIFREERPPRTQWIYSTPFKATPQVREYGLGYCLIGQWTVLAYDERRTFYAVVAACPSEEAAKAAKRLLDL